MATRRPCGLTRRSFLLVAWLPVAVRLPLRPGGDGMDRDIVSWLRGVIPGADAAAIGARYLGAHPEEAPVDRLAQELFGCRLEDETDAAGFERLMRRVLNRRERDFLDGELVVLDGWVVPRTEARLLALLAGAAR